MTFNRLRMQMLPDEQIAQIEETAYRLLEEVGVLVQHARAQEMLHGLGCHVEKGRIFMPRQVVLDSVKRLTSANTYRNRDGSVELVIGDGRVRFHNSGSSPYIMDLDSGKRRPATRQDTMDMIRLLDALPNLDVITPSFGPQDMPPALMSIAATELLLHHTNKPATASAAENAAEVRYQVELAAACCGGMEAFRRRPTLAVRVSPVSPLTFSEKITDAIITCVELGAPFHALPAPSLGATGPITLAGCLAQQHAELLASFVIVAATRSGAAVSYCCRINPIDMRTAVSAWGGPEVGMAGACAVQLARRLGLVIDVYGLSSSASKLDPQCAYERFANAFTPALAGADILSGVGGLESILSGSFAVAVMDDEMIGLMKHIIAGAAVNEDTLAFDVMRETILDDGVFLSQMHTVKQMRKGVIWTPAISERALNTGEDPDAGVVALARRRVKEILATHHVEPLPDDAQRHLAEIMGEARRQLT